ncbi:predicted protein [Uncinocarpus reesii 1704]|uniref:Histone-lysine N-methyltransferase n=1 Tax=Uncinocarpus reesii (strain UAMH 1704) TaxID=336963 RepID=C4JE47_UNCRE|nr:uncharacterized protein UREG_00487 [Uncinocarpus reesii 1704]EEP75641.1 predicted protein [Uncinocarpus reesii 1704]
MARGPMVSRSSTDTSSTVDSDTTIDATVPVLTPATSVSEPSTPADSKDGHEDRKKESAASRRVTRSSLRTMEFEENGYTVDQGDLSSRFVPTGAEAKDTNQKAEDGCLDGCKAGETMSVAPLSDCSGDIRVPYGEEPTKTMEHHPASRGEAGILSEYKNPRRRSTRLTVRQEGREVTVNASSAPGKRTFDAISKNTHKIKELDRRASLRPRVESQKDSAPAPQPPPAKKRRVSDGDKPISQSSATEHTPRENSLIRRKKKLWLRHGLYAGQEYVDPSAPSSRKRRAYSKKGEGQQANVFPLPMYAGARLLENGRSYKLPFDIFSPLPHGQPKPDEWRKANKNVFVGDATSIWKANKIKEHSTCTCTPETGCDENCHNRYMFYECDDTNCKLGPELCQNRPFSELRRRSKAGGKFNIGVEVIKTEDRGYGVRSNRAFNPNQIIVEYTGEILTQEECERRMRTVYKKNDCYYLMYFDQNMVIDATRGSIARFINHSCEPNCRMEKWTVAGKPRMALFAGEDGIMTGEELTYDYNFDPYSQKNVQECRCGAPTCRGVLGPRQKEAFKNKEKDKGSKTRTTGSKRKSSNAPDRQARRNKKQRLSESTSPKPGRGNTVSKTRTALKSAQSNIVHEPAARKARKTRTVQPIPVKKRGAALTRAKMPAKRGRKPGKASQTQTQTNSRKLNMPSKPRLNSIAAARASETGTKEENECCPRFREYLSERADFTKAW